MSFKDITESVHSNYQRKAFLSLEPGWQKYTVHHRSLPIVGVSYYIRHPTGLVGKDCNSYQLYMPIPVQLRVPVLGLISAEMHTWQHAQLRTQTQISLLTPEIRV